MVHFTLFQSTTDGSRPLWWSLSLAVRRLLLLSAALAVVSGCGLKTHSGPGVDQLEDAEVVTIKESWDCPFCLFSISKLDENGRGIFFLSASKHESISAIRLSPGLYRITIGYSSFDLGVVKHRSKVQLQAGHSYTIEREACFMLCFRMDGYTHDIWMEDRSTGEIVAGCRQGYGCAPDNECLWGRTKSCPSYRE